MNRFLMILLVMACVQGGFGQPNPDTLWTRTYEAGGYDYARSVQQTADGGYIVAIHTESIGAGWADFYLVKTSIQGDTLWTRTYGGSNDDFSTSVQQTTDGGYIVAGYTFSFSIGGIPDFYLVKTNGEGDTLWTHSYGRSSLDLAFSVQQTADGGYIVAGYALPWLGGSDFYVVRTNGQGDTLWTHTYGGGSYDYAYSVQQTTDGGYIVVGYTQSFGAGSGDFYLVKTNSQGDTLWTRTYGGSNDDEAYSVQQTTDGGYVVAGSTGSFGAGGFDFYLVKTNSLGDTLWTRTYGGSSNDYGYSVQQTADGGYIVAGTTWSFGQGTPSYSNMYLVKTNGQGDTLWTRTQEGSSYDDEAYSVQQTADAGYIVAGCTYSFGSGLSDFYVEESNYNGFTHWGRTYGGSSYDRAYSVQQTADGGYIVAGETYSFGAGAEDFYLVKINGESDTLWTRTYGGSSRDWAYSVQQTPDGGYIVAGVTWSFGAGSGDFYLVKTNGEGDTLWTRTYGGSNTDEAYCGWQTADGGYIMAGVTYSPDVTDRDFYLVKTGPEKPRVVIWIQNENAVLNWPPSGAPSYNIYGATEPFISGSLLNTTSDTTWTDSNTSGRPSPYFYYVTAVAP